MSENKKHSDNYKLMLVLFANWEENYLEKIEYNEHLRILERGHRIKAIKVDSQGISVDTELDLVEVKYQMVKDPYYKAILNIV